MSGSRLSAACTCCPHITVEACNKTPMLRAVLAHCPDAFCLVAWCEECRREKADRTLIASPVGPSAATPPLA
jgi:hypothetical protein